MITIVWMLCCLIPETRGNARIAGLDTGYDPTKIRQIIGLIPEMSAFAVN